MIITSEILNEKTAKVTKFVDTTCLVSIVNTEGQLGVVCYLNEVAENYEDESVWQPFSLSNPIKFKTKAKTYRELINSIPPISRDNVADIKGKFYNTFDTPVEVNNEILTTTFAILSQNKTNILERKTYYLITDVQELERTFNPNIMPCEIINFNQINEFYKDKPVNESLKFVVENILNKN